MRLYMSIASPFVRKCRVVLREKGLLPQVEEIALDFPYKAPDYTAVNPVGQVPALVLEDGTVFTNSPVICDYLDRLGSGPRLLPPDGEAHWKARRLEALGDQINEMAVKVIMESRRPEGERSPTWTGHWREGLVRALDVAERQAPEADALDLGGITLAIAATYAGFRYPEIEWRKSRPRLSALNDALEARDSFRETYPR
ncbi:MAG: glutathione S-transferase N-terminal domain-containing protein [Proteobacteria bacterium]|nr:glutathione S-transferase N-terminal domain-containing protein [Pseudomonadota bacterium]